MQIAAFDADDLADDTGKAKISWISKDCLATMHNMNSTNTTEGGWAGSEMRTYLKNTIKPMIPQNVVSMIKEVKKYSRNSSDARNVLSTEDVWIPSLREVAVNAQGNVIWESQGAFYYNTIFQDNSSRIKKNSSIGACIWFLRTVYNTGSFECIQATGGEFRVAAAQNYGVVLGFCT